MAAAPSWLTVQSPSGAGRQTSLRNRGERDAIRLAQEIAAEAILLDDERPRRVATQLGLRVVGTIGVLEQAANLGFVADLKAIHDQLRVSDFYISERVLDDSLRRHLQVQRGRKTS